MLCDSLEEFIEKTPEFGRFYRSIKGLKLDMTELDRRKSGPDLAGKHRIPTRHRQRLGL